MKNLNDIEQKEKIFLKTVELSSQGISLIDENFCFTYVNKSMASMLGLEKNQLLDKSVFDFFNVDNNLVRNKNRFFSKTALKSGKRKFFEISITNIDSDANTKERIFVCTDITEKIMSHLVGEEQKIEQEKLSKALVLAESRYKLAVETTGDFLWDYDLSSKHFYIMESWSSSLGYTNEELGTDINTAWYNLIYPEDKEEVIKHFSEFVEKKQGRFENQHRILKKDGNYIWILSRAGFVEKKLTDKESMRIVGINQNNTESMLLKEENDRLIDVIESSPDYIGIRTIYGKNIYLNPSLSKLLGCGKHENISLETTHPEWAMTLIKDTGIPYAIQHGIWKGETALVDKHGMEIPVKQIILSHKSSHTSKVEYLSTIMTDITEQKIAERKIEEQRAKIISSSKMSSLGEMASGISHEINNPLTIIKGNAYQISSIAKSENPDIQKIIKNSKIIDDTVSRIDKIVKGLKTFARDGEHDPLAPVTVKQIIDETLALCHSRFYNHNIQFEIVNPFENILVKCRSVQIVQVLINLLNNAHDAIENTNSPWVKLMIEEAGARVRFTVKDSGPGIPDELVEKIIQPFFTTKEVGKGTGLGLSISIGIIEQHGGKLYYDKTSKNTSFVFELEKG